jgi:DNA segregation ATPase FtsK/SpoIIIE, S-DNA-T family
LTNCTLSNVYCTLSNLWGARVKLKKIQKKSVEKKEAGITKYNHEIIGLLLLAFGVLTLLSFYFEHSIGVFGSAVKGLLLGLMGAPAFLVPPLIITYGFFIIFKKDNTEFILRSVYIFVLLVFISALLHIIPYDYADYENSSAYASLKNFVKEGKTLQGGGFLGGIISHPLLLVFQKLGTIIILTTLAIIDIILLTNISIAAFLRNTKEWVIWKRDREEDVNTPNRKQKGTGDEQETGFEPEVVENGSALSLEFKAKPKIIDFKIEKNARELKNKTGSKKERKEEEALLKENVSLETAHAEPIEFIMKDLKKQEIKKSVEPGELSSNTLQHESHNANYRFPTYDLLNANMEENINLKAMKNSALEGARKLEDTLKSFGVEAKVINVSRGPAVTRYELQPSPGVKVSRIVNLSDDISLNLASAGVRIEAPIPGKAAIGIEVPNKEVNAVYLREVVESDEFAKHPSKLAFALGKDISGESIIADIGKMPHVLIAGATGSGKSVCINSLIMSILYKSSPEEVKLLMVDPKVVELGIYNGIPHLLIPVVTDPKKAAGALNWAVQEMVNRYKLFADKGVRDIKGYNAQLRESGEQGILPQIVIIIDELADLMMVAPGDVEDAICRLAQMARASGMHLVIATQRPSVDVITGVIKANIPSRIAFAVSSQVDSRTILDMGGAEKLLGRGDMLFYPVGEPKPIRIKGAFVTDKEVEHVVEFIKSQGKTEYNPDIIEEINSESEPADSNPGDNDELLNQAINIVVEAGQGSVSLIQRKFKVGYARAARIIDQMEERGIVGKFEGSKPRQVLISKLQWQEMQASGNTP